jgi:hypothetical protein
MEGLYNAYLTMYEGSDVHTIIKSAAKEAGDKSKDMNRSEVERLQKETKEKIKKSLKENIINYLIEEGYAENEDYAGNILLVMGDSWLKNCYETLVDK